MKTVTCSATSVILTPYDNENRVTSKEASKWDSSQEAWVPYFKMDVSYTNSEVELSYARWNPRVTLTIAIFKRVFMN